MGPSYLRPGEDARLPLGDDDFRRAARTTPVAAIAG